MLLLSVHQPTATTELDRNCATLEQCPRALFQSLKKMAPRYSIEEGRPGIYDSVADAELLNEFLASILISHACLFHTVPSSHVILTHYDLQVTKHHKMHSSVH